MRRIKKSQPLKNIWIKERKEIWIRGGKGSSHLQE
jgi:hypothetical protein